MAAATAAAPASASPTAATASGSAAASGAAAGDPFAALDKDALQPLSPETMKRHTAADIQIYAAPTKEEKTAQHSGEWKCKACSWKNSAGTTACYLCKASQDGTKKDAKPKASAFADKIDMNNAELASPSAASALDELMGTAKK